MIDVHMYIYIYLIANGWCTNTQFLYKIVRKNVARRQGKSMKYWRTVSVVLNKPV